MGQVSNPKFHPLFVPQRDYVNESLLGKPGHRLAPVLDLRIFKPGGRNATEHPRGILDQHLLSVEVEEDIKMTSHLTMTLSNPDWVVSDSDILTAGTQFDVNFGYSSGTIHLGRRFELVHQMPMFPRSDIPTLQVSGYDGRHRMTSGDKLVGQKELAKKARKELAKTRSFKDKRDTEIVKAIADIYDFNFDLDQTEGRRTRVKKSGKSDWEFILHLAKFNDFETWVDYRIGVGWTLHFRKEDLREPADYWKFVYGEDGTGSLLECTPELEMAKQSTDVDVLSYDRRLRKVTTSELSETKDVVVKSVRGGIKGGRILESVDYGSKVRFTAFGRTMEVIANRPFRRKKDAKKYAENYLREREKDFVTCTGTLIGVENVRPRQVHHLDGLGVKYSGFYKFIQTTQRWAKDSTYETDFVGYKVIPERAQVHRKVTASVVDFEGEA